MRLFYRKFYRIVAVAADEVVGLGCCHLGVLRRAAMKATVCAFVQTDRDERRNSAEIGDSFSTDSFDNESRRQTGRRPSRRRIQRRS